MSGIPEAVAHIERQIDHLNSAAEQFTSVEIESGHAIENGMLAHRALGEARVGIDMYTQSTEEALTASGEASNTLTRAWSTLQDPVGSARFPSAKEYIETANNSSQLAAKKRDIAIASGTIAVKGLRTALAGIIGFLDHTQSARTHAADTMTELLSAHKITASTPVIKEDISTAHQETDSHSVILEKARMNIIRYIGSSFDASDTEITASLFSRIAGELEEGVVLLEESKDKPIDMFKPAAQAALEKIDLAFNDLLEDLRTALVHGNRTVQDVTKQSRVPALIQNSLQQRRSLLTQL